MSVFGLDIGNNTSSISVAQRGGVDVCFNEVSNRETGSAVAFTEKERLAGDPAAQQAIRNWKSTVVNFKRLLGIKFNSALADHERKYCKFPIREAKDGFCEVGVQFKGEEQWFSIEQIVAIFMGKMRAYAEKEHGGKVRDCVLACPAYWTAAQRRRMIAVAGIADVNVLNICNETTAAALAYGIQKTASLPEDEKQADKVLFFDFGHSCTTVSVVAFWKGAMRTLFHLCDPYLGVRDIVESMFQHFAAETQKKYGINIKEDKRNHLRLWTACERTLKVLSANPVTPLNCELSDTDLQFPQVKREEVESWCSEQSKRMNALLTNAFNMIPVDQLHSVEVLGGGSRIPFVKKMVSDLGKEPSTTLNATESVCKGCGINGAMLSPKFTVREFQIWDSNMYPIHVGYKSEKGTDSIPELPQFNKRVFLIHHNGSVPKTLTLTFDRSEDFELACVYENSDLLVQSGTSTVLGLWKVTNIPPVQPKPSVKVSVRLSTDGSVAVDNAHVTEDYEAEETIEVPEEEPMDVDAKKEESEGDAKSDTAKSPTEEKKEKPKPKMVKKTVMKKKQRKVACAITQMRKLDLDPALIQGWKEKERVMALADLRVHQANEAKNALETYVYDYKSKAGEGGPLCQYLTAPDREAFLRALEETNDWLYADGEENEKEAYDKKLKELHAWGNPADQRLSTYEALPTAFHDLLTKINEVRTKTQDDKYSHISQEDLQSIVKKCDDTAVWLTTHQQKVQAQKKEEQPVVTAEVVRLQGKELDSFANPIFAKPKPKPAKEEKKEENDKKAETNTTESKEAEAMQTD
eukprot:NODE_72_length_2932_cov_222.913285_g56_i0.p1 GENE.NODE_72_length_2932_cov_222.913285_g56_i0~~NODE_72_length_2932_cov_222.913285_g56_i0.p1  ORF type:complete len:805 (-),score=327.75 NODE_72_length_2932_cov_222.913285_g56_i0:302-2716(-)